MRQKIAFIAAAAVFVALLAGSVWLGLWASPDRGGDSYDAPAAQKQVAPTRE